MNMYLELTIRYYFCIMKAGSSQRRTVKFPDNRIKAISISFQTVHFIFLSVALKQFCRPVSRQKPQSPSYLIVYNQTMTTKVK